MLFLNFMYGVNVPYDSLGAAVELLEIAEKYEITALKKICENMLIENITEADPVHSLYQIACRYNCSSELIKKVYDLVQR